MRAALHSLVLLAVAVGLTAGGAVAGDLSGAEVGRMVRAALAAAGQPTAGVRDPLRAFPACDHAPVVGPSQGRWTVAELRCDSPAWRRQLRTGVPGDALTAAPRPADQGPAPPPGDPVLALVLTRSLARDAVIAPGDVALRPMSPQGAEQIFTDPAQIIGRRMKTALGPGHVLLLRHLAPDYLVEPGMPLALVAQAGPLSVTAPAESRQAGQLGDIIRVVNLVSGKELKAIVTARGRVTVTP